jgi:hypothetical protein
MAMNERCRRAEADRSFFAWDPFLLCLDCLDLVSDNYVLNIEWLSINIGATFCCIGVGAIERGFSSVCIKVANWQVDFSSIASGMK